MSRKYSFKNIKPIVSEKTRNLIQDMIMYTTNIINMKVRGLTDQ